MIPLDNNTLKIGTTTSNLINVFQRQKNIRRKKPNYTRQDNLIFSPT